MTLLERTGQNWKVYLFIGLFVLGCAASLLQGFFYASLGKDLAIQIALGGVFLIVGSFVWAGQNVTCPKCQLKLFYHAFRHQKFLHWFAWLLQLEACPKCGPAAEPRRPRSGKKSTGLKRP